MGYVINWRLGHPLSIPRPEMTIKRMIAKNILLGIETNCAAYESSLGPAGDEEDFAPDIYNDELEEGGDPKKPKKPDDSFGDELEGGGSR